MGKNKAKKNQKGQNKNFTPSQSEVYAVPREEYDKFLAFCKIKDQLISLVNELEDGWDEHCVALVQEFQLDIPVVNTSIDDTIVKIQDVMRTIRYGSQKSKNKKNRNKWIAPLSGGVTNTIKTTGFYVAPSKRKKTVNSAKDKDKNKEKPLTKSEISLEHIGRENGKPPLTFYATMKVEEPEEPQSIQELIEASENYARKDHSICEHGNRNPCEICESERYYSID